MLMDMSHVYCVMVCTVATFKK